MKFKEPIFTEKESKMYMLIIQILLFIVMSTFAFTFFILLKSFFGGKI
jgi:hypothetical protein